MIEIERHIEFLLLSNDCVIIPNFGGFMAHYVDACYDGRDNTFLPPKRTIGFNPQLQLNDSLLALSYVEAYDISYPEALRRIESEVAEIRQTLENKGSYEFNGIGSIILNEDGNYEFEPCEAGILTPGLYGLGGVTLLPLAEMQTEAESSQALQTTAQKAASMNVTNKSPKDKQADALPQNVNSPLTVGATTDETSGEETAEFISIKKSWLRNIAAACIALIAFFTLSTPLGSPTLQKSQIDTGMLTRLMPKEAINAPHELMLNNQEAEALPSETSNTSEMNLASGKAHAAARAEQETKQETEEAEYKAPATTYYCIVLASRVTKRNAACYAEQLQAKGFKGTRVLISDSNVKVIYGNYATETQAYSQLNRLRDNEVFEEGWVTKVKE